MPESFDAFVFRGSDLEATLRDMILIVHDVNFGCCYASLNSSRLLWRVSHDVEPNYSILYECFNTI